MALWVGAPHGKSPLSGLVVIGIVVVKINIFSG